VTNIWVPRAKILEPKRELIMPVGVRGFLRCRAIRPDGRVRPLTDWFPNLIVTAGLNAIGTANNYLTACRVGTGTAPPSPSDTGLGNQIAGTSSRVLNQSGVRASPPYYGARTITYEFAEGAAAGNLTEVGIATAATGGSLFSRALILDGEGNPTSITVLSDEILQVDYQLRLYPPTSDVVGSITISGNNYDYTLRAADVTSSAWAIGSGSGTGSVGGGSGVIAVDTHRAYETQTLGSITESPSGSSQDRSNVSNASYVTGTFYRDYTVTWGLTAGNFTLGIGSITSRQGTDGFFGKIQMNFTPRIPKDNTKILSITFRHAWSVHTI
jgi:hypothetical protein